MARFYRLETEEGSCSFCGKQRRWESLLLGGGDNGHLLAICSDCAATAAEIFEERANDDAP